MSFEETDLSLYFGEFADFLVMFDDNDRAEDGMSSLLAEFIDLGLHIPLVVTPDVEVVHHPEVDPYLHVIRTEEDRIQIVVEELVRQNKHNVIVMVTPPHAYVTLWHLKNPSETERLIERQVFKFMYNLIPADMQFALYDEQ